MQAYSLVSARNFGTAAISGLSVWANVFPVYAWSAPTFWVKGNLTRGMASASLPALFSWWLWPGSPAFYLSSSVAREVIKGEKVSKKDKKIEVSVKDIERRNQPVQQIFIGDRLIGEVVTDNERFKAMLMGNQSEFYVRSQEEGLEIILQQYHLHQH